MNVTGEVVGNIFNIRLWLLTYLLQKLTAVWFRKPTPQSYIHHFTRSDSVFLPWVLE